MKKAIPFFRSRKQKSGRYFYYFEYRSETGQRKERPLGNDLDEALLQWQQMMKVSVVAEPQLPSIAWLIERFRVEQLPLIEPRQKQRQTWQELGRLHRFFTSSEHGDLTEISQSVALLYAHDTLKLYRRRRDWSLLVVVAKWAVSVGYLRRAFTVPSAGLSDEIRQQESDELRRLLLNQIKVQESVVLPVANDEVSQTPISKRTFETARQVTIQKAKSRKRIDLVLALEEFRWLDFCPMRK